MDKHQIGVNAGKVWKLLNDNKRWSYCDLKRALIYNRTPQIKSIVDYN